MATRSDPPPQRVVTRRLTRRYVLALAAIGLLGLLSQVVVQVSISQLAQDTHVIQIAALQRTLAERLSKDALAILFEPSATAQGPYADEMHFVVPQWENTHLALQQGDPSLGLPGQNSLQVTQLFAQVAPSFNVMQDAATKLLAAYDSQPPVPLPQLPTLASIITPYVEEILTAEPGFISGMDAIVAQYQAEADARVRRLQTVEWTLLATELVVVVALGALIFRPATRFIGQSIADLEQAREREHELAALKDQFIVDANHELRTPIMALYNNLEILAALTERGSPEQRARVLQRALSSGDAVLRLLHSVLDAGALEGKPPRLESKAVSLAPLVRAILETFDPNEIGEIGTPKGEYEARAVTMHVPAELVVWADEGRLRQVLINLIANALKYSDPGTPIFITAAAGAGTGAGGERHHGHGARSGEARAAAGEIYVGVRDQGLGVPPRDVSKLFNRFVRLERDIAGSVRGTGVGLYMCRMLVEAMDGRIWVESSGVPGEGSTFAFVLPAATPEMVAGVGVLPGAVAASAGATTSMR
jgi:signal transduction histidine kinase